MAEHFQGKMVREGLLGVISNPETGRLVVFQGADFGGKTSIARHATIDRLIACWNACEGIPTIALEASAFVDGAGFVAKETVIAGFKSMLANAVERREQYRRCYPVGQERQTDFLDGRIAAFQEIIDTIEGNKPEAPTCPSSP